MQNSGQTATKMSVCVRESMLIQIRGRPGNDVKFALTFGDVTFNVDVHNGVNSVSRLPW